MTSRASVPAAAGNLHCLRPLGFAGQSHSLYENAKPRSDVNIQAQTSRDAPGSSAEVHGLAVAPMGMGYTLAGGGEMGALMRAKDWSATPLGDPSTWPQSLRTSLSIMLESRFAMVVAWGADYRFFYNDGYRPVLGVKHPSSLGTPGREIFPEVWEVVGPEFDRVRRGESFAIEDWLLPLDRNGYLENCWFTLSYSPIRDESGGVGGVLAVVAETTDRVQGERRLATLRDLARSSEAKTPAQACERAAAIFDANTVDVPFSLAYLLDADGKRARLAAASQLEPGSVAAPLEVDVSLHDDAGWPLHAAMTNHTTLVVEDVAARFGELPGGPHPERTHTAIVLPLPRAGTAGVYGALVLGVSPRRALDERYRSFLELAAEHVVAAIASASAYEEERRRAEMLAELDRAKTQFFSNVSHEFRTPLTLLLGPVGELLSKADQSPGDRRALELIEGNAHRLLKLVNTLLDFSRLEAGRVQATYREVDLAGLTADLASAFRSTVERAGLALRVDCEPPSEAAFVDREMWEKIVLNLLSNAFKHTFEGAITVRLRSQDGWAVLTVTDTGVGIPTSEQGRIFDRFHQVPSARSRTHEGSGIGLSLVRELARLHGGDADVRSTEGEGSTFEIRIRLGRSHLPAEQVVANDASEFRARHDDQRAPFTREAAGWIGSAGSPWMDVDATGASPSADPVLAGARILVVDDNADMREYIGRLLSQSGAVVTLATTGEEALDRARVESLDVVLSDVMMPGMDGFGLLTEMRADPELRSIPFVVLSARAGEESRIGGLAAGADDYLIKPFVAKELIARIAAQLRVARARRAERRARADADAARRQMWRVFEQAPVPICVVEGRELLYTTANAFYRQIIGNRDPLGKRFLELWPELEGSAIHEILLQVFDTGEPHVAREFKLEFDQFGTGQRVEAYFNFVYHPLVDDVTGRTRGIIAVAPDVTAQVLARREADRLRLAAEAANEAKLQLLRTVSHETRQPVHASLGYLDLLTLGIRGDLTEEQRSDLENIRKNQTHLLRLLNDILSFARLEAGALPLEMTDVTAADVVAAVEPLVMPQFASKGVACVVAPVTTDARFRGDRERSIQVCVNLLTNALKATPPGGCVTISCDARPDKIEIRVQDTGCGIPPEKLEEIFDPFSQLARARATPRHEGIGLGLSISRQLARAMKGDLHVKSQVAAGSTFTFVLPRSGATQEQATG